VYKLLVYIDPHNPSESLGLLETAAKIAPESQLVSYAFCSGKIDLYAQGHFDFYIWADTPIEPYDAQSIAVCLESLQELYGFDAILVPATTWGRSIAPRAAMRMRVGLVADITDVERDAHTVRLVRPAFDGKLLATVECVGDKPLMASVRPGAFRYEGDARKNTQQLKFSLFPGVLDKAPIPNGIRLIAAESKPAPSDIRESDVLVSAGGGVGEAIGQLEPLTGLLGGMVSASRRLVDEGLAPRAIQVGQSGKTVSPRVYFALGIYGALQHIEGLRNVECIISVNTNRKAPICSISDIVVVGDAVEFAKKLVARLEG